MCGLSGIYKRRGAPVDIEDIARMCSAIAHRGPDDAGYARLAGGAVGLGHVRLSILDLTTGDQPLYNEDHTVCLVYNGEIYRHEALRRELEEKGHRFRTRTDSEVIIHLYEEYGLDFFDHLNGEFAFVLWDERKKQLIAARDRAGVKPLFYANRGDEILFCSEVKGIFALGRLPRALSNEYLTGPCLATFPQAASAFEGVHAVKPGHYLIVDASGEITERPYWSHRFDVDPSITFEDAKEGVRSLFTAAVRERMIADVPVGTYLSGGLDSTLVCGLMAELSGSRVRAFNVGFRGSIYDESYIAARVAKHFGVSFDTVDCTMDLIARNYEWTTYHVEGVLLNPHAVAKQILSRLVRSSGYKVCITGEGADEVFGGYPFFKLEALWRMARDGGGHESRALTKRFYELERRTEHFMWERGDRWRKSAQTFGYPSYLELRAERLSNVEDIFETQALGLSPRHKPSAILRSSADIDEMRRTDPFNVTRRLTFNQLSSYILMALGDRVEMANSVECRVPFLDRDLLDFTGKVPPQHFMDLPRLREKHLLREAFTHVMPRFLAEEHKHPFMAPSWMQFSRTKEGRAIFEEFLSEERVKRVGIYKPSFIRRLKFVWRALPERLPLWKRFDNGVGLMLSVHMLHHLFVEREISSTPRFAMVDRSPPRAEEARDQPRVAQ
ncbi:MAG TPA: asparagine synthase (glutamine-hydrolyzing) [Candidatus Nanopelagicales bacterium]|nr:asparagine synthase (glutamine-hydrolyzing) [Candidatus Nanopelagicales bacterium]